jgi:exonuclease 1
MDSNGDGQEVDLALMTEATELNFRTFTQEMLLITCILSGCDYLESIKGIGFKKAHRLVYENGADIKQILRKIRRDGK